MVIVGNSKAEVLVGHEVNIPEKVELRQPVHWIEFVGEPEDIGGGRKPKPEAAP